MTAGGRVGGAVTTPRREGDVVSVGRRVIVGDGVAEGDGVTGALGVTGGNVTFLIVLIWALSLK